LGIAAVAHQYRFGFVPLVDERYDLMLWRAAYIEEHSYKSSLDGPIFRLGGFEIVDLKNDQAIYKSRSRCGRRRSGR
jgi:hypothetical protein